MVPALVLEEMMSAQCLVCAILSSHNFAPLPLTLDDAAVKASEMWNIIIVLLLSERE